LRREIEYPRSEKKRGKKYADKKRSCPECGQEMSPRFINLLYKKEDCEIQVEVIGIPANVCGKCFYRIIPGKVAKHIDSLTDPIFEAEISQKEKILPAPHIGIQFPPIKREVLSTWP